MCKGRKGRKRKGMRGEGGRGNWGFHSPITRKDNTPRVSPFHKKNSPTEFHKENSSREIPQCLSLQKRGFHEGNGLHKGKPRNNWMTKIHKRITWRKSRRDCTKEIHKGRITWRGVPWKDCVKETRKEFAQRQCKKHLQEGNLCDYSKGDSMEETHKWFARRQSMKGLHKHNPQEDYTNKIPW